MAKIKAKIDCCGSDFEQDKVSVFGLFTLSIPLFFVLLISYVLLFPLSFFKSIGKISSNIKVLINANLKLIEKQTLLPSLRCLVSAKTIKVSPIFSQFLFRTFNFNLLLIGWVFIFTGAWLIV